MLSPLELEIQSLEQKKQNLEVAIFDIETKITVADKKLLDINKEVGLAESIKEASDKELRKVADRVADDINSIQFKKSVAQEELTALIASVDDNRAKVQLAESELAEITVLYENSKNSFAADIFRLKSEQEGLTIQVESAQAKVTELENTFAQLVLAIDQANKDIFVASQKVGEVESLENMTKANLSILQDQIELLKETKTVVQNEIVAEKESLEAEAAKIVVVKKEIAALEKERDLKEKDILAIGFKQKEVDDKEKRLREYYERAGVAYPTN